MSEPRRRVTSASTYLLVGLPTALASILVLPVLAVGAIASGLTALPLLMRGLRHWSQWHRKRASALLGVEIRPRPARLPKGLSAQWRRLLDDPEYRRDLRWVLRHVITGLPAGLAALLCVGTAVGSVVVSLLWPVFPKGELQLFGTVPVTGWATALALAVVQGGVGVAATWWAVPRLARMHARATLAALEPSPEARLAERVGELSESRAGVLDAHGAELRRIERDLHDGTQARLVAIAMRLGVAREELPDDAGALATLLQEAHEGTEEAMAELRNVIRTMYPPILADRGLEGAVSAVTAGTGIPADVEVGELGRLPAAVEAAAYFIVAETLTNAAKYSGATHVTVRLTRPAETLLVEVVDNGLGGIDETLGSGVIGIRRRAAALDGTVLISSPVGGPTAVTVELPCA
ncbi:sensor histidine kinase [Streptomyces sp. NBC_00708]